MSAEASLEGVGIDVRSEYSCSVHGPKGLRKCVGPTELYCILQKGRKEIQSTKLSACYVTASKFYR